MPRIPDTEERGFRTGQGIMPLRDAFVEVVRHCLRFQLQHGNGALAVLKTSGRLLCVARVNQGQKQRYKWLLMHEGPSKSRHIDDGSCASVDKVCQEAARALGADVAKAA